MLGFNADGTINFYELEEMKEEEKRDEETHKDKDEMTDQERFDMKADLDRDQMIDDTLTD